MPAIEQSEEFQKKYLEFYIVDQQLKQLHQHLMLMEKQAAELAGLLEAIEELKNAKPNAEMFAPLGAGVFVKAALKETDELLLNIGANTALTKSREESKKLVEAQLNELHESIKQLEPNVHALMQRCNELKHELKGMQEGNEN